MSTEKINCAIIGSGNIGTDLMYKLLRSDYLNLTAVIGIDKASDGLQLAKKKGIDIYSNGIEAVTENPNMAEIFFEATSAKAHMHNASILKSLNKKVVDLTPAAIGPFVVPSVNIDNLNAKGNENVNMVTCGGQATIPMVKAVSNVVPVEYAEIISSVSSKSAGPGTRQNIDEFTETTSNAIEQVGGAKKAKTIILLNPADPPIMMRNTIYIEIDRNANSIKKEIEESLNKMIEEVNKYVPGYSYKADTTYDNNIVTVFIEVEGKGDFLPPYAGNLDIITSAATRTGELIAKSISSDK